MKKEINKEFDMNRAGKRLREMRLKTGLTAKQLGEKVGCTESGICSYEIGRRIPNDEMKVKIANFLGVTVQSLFFD